MPHETPPLAAIMPPSRRTKLGFWLLLGMFSTAFAEVSAGSSPFPFFHPWGILVTTPLYTLHIVLLAAVLIQWRRLTWNGLLFAGALFGLYEAYITKVLWHPDWGNELPRLAEVSWLHFSLLVLCWHPLLAFIIPLGLGEALLARSGHVARALPPRWHGWIAAHPARALTLLAAGCGALASANAQNPVLALLSPAANALLLGGLTVVWQRKGSGRRYSLEALLPGPAGLKVFAGVLAVFYVIAGLVLLPERLPGAPGHVAIIACYVLFIFALARVPAQTITTEEDKHAAPTPCAVLVQFACITAITALVSKLVLGPFSVALVFVVWLGACTAGVYIYTRALWITLGYTPQRRAGSKPPEAS